MSGVSEKSESRYPILEMCEF